MTGIIILSIVCVLVGVIIIGSSIEERNAGPAALVTLVAGCMAVAFASQAQKGYPVSADDWWSGLYADYKYTALNSFKLPNGTYLVTVNGVADWQSGDAFVFQSPVEVPECFTYRNVGVVSFTPCP